VSTIQFIAIAILPLLFAITMHEVAHGWVALRFGDTTAKMLGRLSFNPIKHIDPIGTLLVPGLMMLLGGIIFGWAKPVPVNFNNLHHPRRDMAWVAIAGPSANLLMAIGWALIMKLALLLHTGSLEWLARPLIYMGSFGIKINLILMVLNLLPIPPLDGGRVLSGLLPPRAAMYLDRVEPYGLIILILLLFTGVLGGILFPMYQGLEGLLLQAFGLPAVFT
jgi:Zn-dependent protease